MQNATLDRSPTVRVTAKARLTRRLQMSHNVAKCPAHHRFHETNPPTDFTRACHFSGKRLPTKPQTTIAPPPPIRVDPSLRQLTPVDACLPIHRFRETNPPSPILPNCASFAVILLILTLPARGAV